MDSTQIRVQDGSADEKTLVKLQEKAQDLYDKIRTKLGAHCDTCGTAYVTFDQAEDAQAAAQTYKPSQAFRRLCCKEPTSLLCGSTVYASRADEASDNLRVPPPLFRSEKMFCWGKM